MDVPASSLQEFRNRLKELIIRELALEDVTPDDIDDHAPLFGEGLGLDSLDAVEIVVIVKRNFGVEIKNAENRKDIFASVDALAQFVHTHSAGLAARAAEAPPTP